MSILLFGDINLDFTLMVNSYPESGKDAIVQQVSTQLGGSITNTAIVLAGMGLPVRLMGRAGQDASGDQVLAALLATGVDLSLVQRDQSAPTGQIFIVVSADGERTMFSARGANALISPESIPNDALEGVSRLHLSTYSFLAAPQNKAAQKLIEMALGQGIPISLDIADGHAARLRPELEALACKLNALLLNPTDAKTLISPSARMENTAIANALLHLGAGLIALKLGAQGCLIAAQEATIALPALPAAVVDTTGAGDAFAAGLIYARYTGLSLTDTGWLASALGALATTVSGAGTALPGRKELKDYLVSLPPSANSGSWQESLLNHLDL